jgi:hypothetical protein
MFWGGKKTFASFHDNHHSDIGTAIWCIATFDSQSDLVALDPDVFFVPPYVGPSRWVGIEVSGNVDSGLLGSVLEQGCRAVAPKWAGTMTRRVFGKGPPIRRIGGSIAGSATAMRMDANLESGQEVVDANPTDRPRRT